MAPFDFAQGREPTFLLDRMLGRVAKWLLLLGYDAAFAGRQEEGDFDLAYRARQEGRILLTRDTRIPPFAGLRLLVLREQRFEDQLRRVFAEFGLRAEPGRLFSRCTECNLAVRPLQREGALPRVPEKVRTLDTRFYECPGCRRVYWSGTHVGNTIEKLRAMGLL